MSGAAALMAAAPRTADAYPGVADTDILNYVLNLEYLEAEFFNFAAFGHGLPAANVVGQFDTQGSVTGGKKAKLSSAIDDYAKKFAQDEFGHVRYLRMLIGSGNVVAVPEINIGEAFTTFAVAAGLIVQGQTFDPYHDDVSFLLGASIFEDLIASAYAFAATAVSRPAYRQALVNIGIAEGYHAGALRSYLANLGAGVAFNALANLIDALSESQDDQGVLIPGNSHNFITDSGYGAAFALPPSAVLPVLYGTPTGTGLFFPNGLNGLIR